MHQLVFALWEPRGLMATPLRDALAAAGATSVQVNLSDDAVAQAMLRLTTFDRPVEAFVTVRGDVDRSSVERALEERSSRLAGWLVEVEEPLPTPPIRNGVRTDALANIALLRRPPELPYDDWLTIWKRDHTAVAIETQATFGYVQNRVLEPVTAGAPEVAGIVEELFPMDAATDLHAFYGSNGDDEELQRRITAMLSSVARFGADRDVDVVPTSRYCWSLTGGTLHRS